MKKNVLITGGAGFIGSHVADSLLARGYRVRALDNLSAQVHGSSGVRPTYLADDVELMVGDVCDAETVRRSLKGIDGVFHLAAAVGVGQSMYELAHYTRVNNLGTAILLEALIERPVERLIVASSMSIYGEGAYRRQSGEPALPGERDPARLRQGDWELRDETGAPLTAVPTAEMTAPQLASVYALSKYDQERLCVVVGKAYGIPTTALRFFNVYGPRQALSNPYTGVLAIFAARLLNGKPPLVFEDGKQRRDFVHVLDVAEACRLAYECETAAGRVLNVGSGNAMTVQEVAEQLAAQLAKPHLKPEITRKYRAGDIRHCFADTGEAARTLGYQPRVQFADGLRDLAAWLEGQIAADRIEEASRALDMRGLTA